jgi:plasmid stabilization system protein ParE
VPQLIVAEGAADGLERCRRFLAVKAPEAARRAGQAIKGQLLLLETAPDIGRPFPEMPELRELVIAFGDSGYIAL